MPQAVTILLTHNHDDHIGGVEEIVARYPDTVVYGPVETEELNDVTVKDGDSFEINKRTFDVFKTAGHSKEHISYLVDEHLFCGDALFSGGCGRVFTGDYQAQFDALQTFNQLPGRVKIYAGHEYTETNLRFAHSIDPSNERASAALDEVISIRGEGLPTLPSTIDRERQINVFLQAETLEEFVELRKARDQF